MNDDKFVIIQSWLNICEAVISFIAIFLSFSTCRIKRSIAAVLCFTVSAFVFWKTIIFVWYDHYWLSPEALTYSQESLLCYYLPSSLWIFLPLISMFYIGRNFVRSLSHKGSEEDAKKVKSKAA